MRNIILLPKPKIHALHTTRSLTLRVHIIPRQSLPAIPPLLMYPWFVDYEQECDDDGVPCWSGYHPRYPYEEKWFSNEYGPVGRHLPVRGFERMVEIASITAEPFSGVWCWLIGLKVVEAVHA